MAESFSLKDALFNRAKVSGLAAGIARVYPAFHEDAFVEQCVERFPELELKQRIAWIRECLRTHLPDDFRSAVRILLDALPPPLDPAKTDNDFGDFIYAPLNDFVAVYGRARTDLRFSLHALRKLTMRFSAEDAIRFFINEYPAETYAVLEEWTGDTHYHVRRLVSEGTRPSLPWSMKLAVPPGWALPLLERLYADPTRYVTRSVANHLNDISKVDPGQALSTLARWEESGSQRPAEMAFIVKHALRTLVKRGHAGALSFLKYSPDPQVTLDRLKLASDTVAIGSALEFEVQLTAAREEAVVVDYIIHFRGKAGGLTNKKVFKLAAATLRPEVAVRFSKRHRLRGDMTTRALYPGSHALEIQVNGKRLARAEFELV
jgi:3-methyladenine DNA glycosylase AlkC